MDAQSDFYSSLVLEPLRKKISPMVPPRSSSLTQSFMDPLVSQGRDSQDAPTMPSSAQRANPDYFTYPWSGHKRLDTSVIQHILFRRIPWMATSGGVAPSRYYGRDGAIDVVMEDITNVENTAASPSSTSSSSFSSNDQPMSSVAQIVPIPKPRTNSNRIFDQSTSDSDDSNVLDPHKADFNVQFRPTREPSIIERIIRTHPIWYLIRNIDRETATHLLSDAQPGNFIVRASSKPRCVALSVRVIQSTGKLTHHFVIETVALGKIRLAGSRMIFHTLPALIEFYHSNGGELQCQLRLPRVVLEARSTEELLKIASIGPDFWNWSKVPTISKNHLSAYLSMVDEATTSFIQPSQSSRIYGEVSRVLHKQSNSQQIPDERSTINRATWQRTSDHKPHYYDSNQWTYNPAEEFKKIKPEMSPGQRLFREGSLNTHSSRRDAENEAPRPTRRSQSVRDTKPREGGRKKSFFKSIFGQKEHKKRAGTPDLAHCTAFQVDQEAIKRSYGSAFDIGEPKIKSNGFGKSYNKNYGLPTMRTFKPLPGEISNIGRPLPPKPSDSDLCNAASALRLAKHNEGSPGPPKSPEARKAMRPPGPTMDPQSKQNCLEELRRKRLQTQHEMLNASPPVGGSPKLAKTNDKFYRVPGMLRSPKKDHRLSVPDLLELPPTQAQESARALRERLGRNEIGELGAINEGLITPVVRRKAFPARHEISHDNNQSSTSVSTNEGSDSLGDRNRMSESIGYGIIESLKPSAHHSPSVQRKESELIWRRNSARRTPIIPEPSTGKSNRSGLIFPDRVTGGWSAVASELTARQQAAKRRSVQNMGLGTVIPSSVTQKMNEPGPSEYTPLADIGDVDTEKERENVDEDNISVAGTIFNEPWDSTTWDNLLDLAHHKDEGMRRRYDPLVEDQENEIDSPMAKQKMLEDKEGNLTWENNSHISTIDSRRKPLTLMKRHDPTVTPMTSMMSLPRARSRYSQCDLTCSLDDLPNMIPSLGPFNQSPTANKEMNESRRTIQDYIEQLAENPDTNTYKTISVFIDCALDSEESDPTAVIRNVRQFINGMKNFFLKQGEGDLHSIFVEQRSRLTANQILNYDAITETVLHRLVLKKLMSHVYRVKIDELTVDGSLEAVTNNIHFVREWTIEKFGFRHAHEIAAPSPQVMEEVKNIMRRMQQHYSPLKKVESMLKGIGIILKTQRAASPDMDNNPKIPAIDQVIRWFIYLIARNSMVGCEIEVWYMKELLPKQALEQGDTSFYLTAMLSSVHLLKNNELLLNLQQNGDDLDHMATLPRIQPATSNTDLFVKVAIPDILMGNIRYYSFPALPQVPSVKFCRIVAYQMSITNPDVYGLYIIMDGFETPVQPHECPDMIRDKLNATGKSFYFAYKQHEVKIAWPGQKLAGLALC